MIKISNIVIEELKTVPVVEQKVEVVERKGLGHPDFICDSIMNQVSIELCKEYIKQFGAIAHHNIDKGLLVAGQTQQKFGGGKVTYPMLLVFGDRATFELDGKFVDVNQIAINSAKDWIRKNLRFVDPERHIKYQVELKKGSAELTDIFKRGGKVLGANDTSAAVGYAPLSQTEQIILETERYLNSTQFKKRYPETGEDIKIMGLRNGSELHLTVAMSFVDRFVESERDYFKKKATILELIKDFVQQKSELENFVYLNTLDQPGRKLGGVYLTVTGTCAESGDSGQVGRGNRVNGIIPLNRPVSSEAAAGKNPVSHVGKIYNVLSHRIADEIYKQIPYIEEVYVWLVSQIGKPIDNPLIAVAQIKMEKGSVSSIKGEVNEVIAKELEDINKFCMDLAYGKIPIC